MKLTPNNCISPLRNRRILLFMSRHVKTKDVIAAIKENNITSLKELCEHVGVGDKCGGCREELDALLQHCLDEAGLIQSISSEEE